MTDRRATWRMQLVSDQTRLPGRLGLLFSLIVFFAVTLAGSVLYNYQKQLLTRNQVDATKDMARTLALSSTSWVLTRDLVGLQEIIQSTAKQSDLVFAQVTDNQGRILSSTNAGDIGKVFDDPVSAQLLADTRDPQVLINDAELIDVAYPVLSDHKRIGWVRVEFSNQTINRDLARIKVAGGLMLLMILLVLLSIGSLLNKLVLDGVGPMESDSATGFHAQNWLQPTMNVDGKNKSWVRVAEAVALFGMIWLVGQIVFLGWFSETFGHVSRGYWQYLLVALAAIRFGFRGATITTLIIGAQAYYGALNHKGFFFDDYNKTGLQNYSFYMIIILFVGLAIANYADDLRRRYAEVVNLRNKDRRANTLLSRMESAAHIGAWELDLRTMELSWTPEVYRIHELPLSTPLILEQAINYYAPEWRPVIKQAVEACIAQGTGWDMELELITGTGRRIWVRALGEASREEGKIVLISGAFQEIGKERAARQLLDDAAQYARSLLEASLDPMMTIDANGKITDVNESTVKMTGLTRGELIGGDFSACFTEPEKARQSYLQVIDEGQVVDYPLVIKPVRGREVNVRFNASLYRNSSGEQQGIFAVARDVTEQNRILDGLQQANADLESFSYSVSHDLRTPLRAIDGFSQIVLEDYGPVLDTEGQRLLTVVRDNTVRMSKLIDDILHFSRAGRVTMNSAPVDMKAMVNQLLIDLQTIYADRTIEFTVAELPAVTGDEALLHQVVENLLSNAIKFTSKVPDARIEIGWRPEGNMAIYYVRDNGVGFDMKYADKLFGVFQRLHGINEFPGTGIGLAIAKRIINRHGGRIWAEAALGAGATFYFSLPYQE